MKVGAACPRWFAWLAAFFIFTPTDLQGSQRRGDKRVIAYNKIASRRVWIICRMPARQGAKRNIISFNPCSCSPFCAVLVIGAPSRWPSFNRRGIVSGASFKRRGAVSGPASDDQATIIHCSGRALCRPRTQRTYKYHANVHPLQGVSLRGRPQPTNNQRASIPHTTHSRDARSSVRKRRGAVSESCFNRRGTVSGPSFNGRGVVSGPSFNRRGAVSGHASDDQATIIHCSGRALCRPRTQRTYKYHANVHPLQGVSLRGRPQPTNNQRASIPHNPPVGTLVRASASGEAPSRGPVVCTHTTHKYRAPQPHPTCRDALRASASGETPHQVRLPTCQSLIYFWGAYLPCIWLCASKMLVNLFEAE